MGQTEPVALIVAAKAIVVKDGKVLILREASTYDEGANIGKYGVPGGRINADESFFAALKREVMEETGLEIEIGNPLHIGEWWPVIKGMKTHIVALYVQCHPIGDNIKLSEEHDSYAWIDADNMSDYNIMPPDGDVISKALAKLGNN